MMTFIEYMNEARSHAEINPKISIVNLLKPYAESPEADKYYITYTTVNKVGINPHTEYETPIGIYSYPLQAIWKHVTGNSIPFAGEAPFVSVLKRKQGKMLNHTATDTDVENTFSVLQKKFNFIELGSKEKEFQDQAKYFYNIKYMTPPKNNFAKIWNLTENVAKLLVMNKKIQAKSVIMGWTYLLSKVLGYIGAENLKDEGIIHPNEKTQAVFFSKNAINVVKTFENKRYGYDDKSDERFYEDDASAIKRYGKVTGDFKIKSTGLFRNLGMNAKYLNVKSDETSITIKYAYVEKLNFKPDSGKTVTFENCIINESNITDCTLRMCFVTCSCKKLIESNYAENCIYVYKNLNEFFKNYTYNKVGNLFYFDDGSQNYGKFSDGDELDLPCVVGGLHNGELTLHTNDTMFIRNLHKKIMLWASDNPVAETVYNGIQYNNDAKIKAVKMAFKYAAKNGIKLGWLDDVFRTVMPTDDFLEYLVKNDVISKYDLEAAKEPLTF